MSGNQDRAALNTLSIKMLEVMIAEATLRAYQNRNRVADEAAQQRALQLLAGSARAVAMAMAAQARAESAVRKAVAQVDATYRLADYEKQEGGADEDGDRRAGADGVVELESRRAALFSEVDQVLAGAAGFGLGAGADIRGDIAGVGALGADRATEPDRALAAA